jgi:pimeloyl-ACP methyl ester carboxylesterase
MVPGDPWRKGSEVKKMRFTLGFWLIRRIFARYPATKVSVRRQIDAVLSFDSRQWIGSLNVPVLVVDGKDDKSIPVTEAEEFTQGIPGAKLVLFEGNHLKIGTNPEVWYTPALEFIAGVDSRQQ